MKPYRGIVKIRCEKKGRCPFTVVENVAPACAGCESAVLEILDLEGKTIFKMDSPTPELRRAGRRKEKKSAT